MAETAFWRLIRANAPGLWVRVENGVGPGTPDCCVAFRTGAMAWVELKDLRGGWDSRLGVRADQWVWMRRWTEAGGRGFFFVRAGKWFILLPGSVTLGERARTREQWSEAAAAEWTGRVDWEQLGDVLCGSKT